MTKIDTKLEAHTEGNRIAPDSQGGIPPTQPVGTAYLAQAFRMDARTVKERLKNCPPTGFKRRGTKQRVPVYDLPVAASYLVTPALSSKEYLKATKRNELPPALQQQVWDALLKRQRWEENAGDLWRTASIREVLGGTFQTIKFTMQLWLETLERQVEVSPAQRQIIISLVDGLQKDIYEALVNNAKINQTQPQLEEMASLVGESGTVEDILQDMNSPDEPEEAEDWESLV